MSSVLWILRLIVLLEIAGAAAMAGWRMSRQPPPLPNLDRLDAVTAAEFRQLRDKAEDESAGDWQQLGDAYVSSGYFLEAENCYRRARALGPESHELMLHWGICLDRLSRTSEAIEKYRRAAALGNARQTAVCRYHAARCYLRENDVDRAEEALRQAGDFPLAQYQLAKLQVRSGRTVAAMPALERLLDAYPDALKLNQLRFEAETVLGNPDRAALYRERADRSQDRLFLDSTVEFLGLLRTGFGLLREQNRCLDMQRVTSVDFGQAAECLRQTLKAKWDDPIVRELIRLELKLGHGAEAIKLIEQRTERFGLSPKIAEQWGDALLSQGQTVEAAHAWERALDMRPNAGLHRKLAEFYSQQEEPEQAQVHRARAEHFLGVRLYRADDGKGALDHLQQAVELDPHHAHSWYYLGECRRVRAGSEQAGEAYRRCLEIDPNHGRAAATLKRLGVSNLRNVE